MGSSGVLSLPAVELDLLFGVQRQALKRVDANQHVADVGVDEVLVVSQLQVF